MFDSYFSSSMPMSYGRDFSQPLVEGPTRVMGAVIAAGTSKAFVLSGESLGGNDPEAVVVALMEGRNNNGLMDDHYQGNKIAFVWSAPFPSGFVFQFFQYDKVSGQVLRDMECSNVAAGCAAYALSSGLAQLDGELSVSAFNVRTNQHMVLTPASPNAPWDTEWNVRFWQEDFTAEATGIDRENVCSMNGAEVKFWAFERGNAFVFSLYNPEEATQSLIAALNEQGGQAVLASGGDPKKSINPKVLLYTVTDVQEDAVCVSVACFFMGEKHKSLPGSGAMTLAGFLAVGHLGANPPMESSGVMRFCMKHPSGEVWVMAHWVAQGGIHQVVATEFITPATMLFDGSFVLQGAADDHG